ncbi:MAG: serine acetyltransferase [Bacteroidetes bacterium]|nr:serine acetyltransferase [Bacteroidota bacterium]
MYSADTTQELTEALLQSYETEGGINHLHGSTLPSRDAIIDIVRDIEALLFPGFFRDEHLSASNLRYLTGSRLVQVYENLVVEVQRNLYFDLRERGNGPGEQEVREQACAIVEHFFRSLPALRDILSTDVSALLEGDPAARSREEIILSYPGLRAIAVHRVAHFLWTHGVRLIARMMSEYIHSRTGIDIHPGARIGRSFYIDHGTGVVIGETTVIGEQVKIYQGVSLGALSVHKTLAEEKRHPTIEDRATIYAGATILGGETVIGHDAVIGGNVWLVKSVPPHSLVTSEPRVNVIPATERENMWSYDI